MEHKKMESDSSHPSGDDSVARVGSEVPARPTSPAEKHTPGPWTLHEDEKWPFGLWIESIDGSCVAQERRQAYSTEQKTLSQVKRGIHMSSDKAEAVRLNAIQVANLRLMAAAPAMLAVLRLVDEASAESDSALDFSLRMDAVIGTVRAAIAKATA